MDSAAPESDTDDIEDKIIHYVVFSASKVVGTPKLARYEESTRSSVSFYKKLKSEERVHFYDGPKILPVAKTAYRKRHYIPTDLNLESVQPFISVSNVYLGILSANHLRKLYGEFGEALFLENIREWLGPFSGKVPQKDRETVNQAIARTLKDEPDKFLARNNGITFRASSVEEQNANMLKLSEASIVNGCQTTMSIVEGPVTLDDCHILVKVVQTDDAWDIAGSANFQTKVDRIDLDIARYVRPQAINAAADKFGVSLKKPSQIPNSIFNVFAAISKAEITEGEIRALFIGLFSRTPNNAIDINYTELRTDLLQKYEVSTDKDAVLFTLFKIQEITQKAAKEVKEAYDKIPRKHKGRVSISELFQRFWHDNSKNAPNYRAFLTILAACGCAGENFFERGNNATYKDLRQFLSNVLSIVENEPTTFVTFYRQAFMSLALKVIEAEPDIDKTLQNMTTYIKRARFDNLYLMLETLSYGNP